ncbi:hypothetical protein L7F22_001656 [Adiantum nelumboides]|nr:hypothetical protein [Adiantum nelumboides]
MEDVAPRRRRAQRSPTPTKGKRSPHSPHRCESKREEKSSRKKKERKKSPSSPSSSPSSSSDKSSGYSSQEKQRRGHRRSYAAWKRSSKLKKFKVGGMNISFLTYDGTFGATDKVLAFIEQFDAAFGDEGFTKSSKLRHVAMHFQKSDRQWWASLWDNGEAPKTWKDLRGHTTGKNPTGHQKYYAKLAKRPCTGGSLSWMADARKQNHSSRHASEGRGSVPRESVPALEVPLSISHRHEDELLSWLQYPLEDSFDKNYCSEEPYPPGAKSNSDIVDNAFSNLTLRETTYTWGAPQVSDIKRGERILTANMAMAMGAQRAAGLLSQSGADAFNKVRTNAQPYAAKRVDNHVIEEPSGPAFNIHKVENPCQNVTQSNFSVFFRPGGVTGMSSEQATYDTSKLTQRANPGSIRHIGGSSDKQTAGFINESPPPFLTNAEQLSPALDTPVIVKEFPFTMLPQTSTTKHTDMGFSRLPLQHRIELGTSEEFCKETLTTDGIEFTAPACVSSESESKVIGLMARTRSAPAATIGLALSSPAGSSGKRIRADTETTPSMPQEDSFFGSGSTVVTDTDSCRQSKLARCTSGTLIGSRMFFSTTDPESKGALRPVRTGSGITTLDSQHYETVGRGDTVLQSSSRALRPVRTGSGITTLDSQHYETVGMGDTALQSSRAWCDNPSKSVTKAFACSAKRKAPFSEQSEFECKVLKDGNPLQRHVMGAKGTQAGGTQTSEKECVHFLSV